jgi:hypothetical protein
VPNRLQHETSPYLRQHADNPVDWYPWGEEAFARARAEDKPILLSIGYSACHWCHVMAHESFEDAETAAQMNRDYVNIKVDREEHPDVDQLYQHALQLLGEHGGWPLTMFLLPTGEPFFGGTYFPPRDAYGRPSFRRVLAGIVQAYHRDRADVVRQGEKVKETLGHFEARGAGDESTSRVVKDLVQRVASRLSTRMDRREGGFEGAPKFPNPTAVNLLLRAFGRSGEAEDVVPALLQLTKMAMGGIYDQLGGGFARYSTDARWLVPHFEKMLYDNGQLLRLYAEGHHVAQALAQPRLSSLYARVIDETVGWLEREMRDASGGLYAAMDADSEGVEGKYYVFTPEEVERTVGAEQAAVFCRVYDVRPGGNWNDPHGHGPQGASVLHVVDTPSDEREEALLAEAREALLKARRQRVPPGTDDKILTAWNGLAVSGLAEAGRLLGEPRYVDAARRTADFALDRLRGADGSLLRTFKHGIAKLPATLDDHAFFAEGLFYLAGATAEPRYLAEMLRLTEESLRRFHDPARHVFYVGPEETSGVRLVQRPVSLIDSAVPSGLSVTLLNMLRLSALSDAARARLQPLAEGTLLRLADQAQQQPFGLSNLIAALDLWQHGLVTTIIVDGDGAGQGEALSAQAAALRAAASSLYLPDHFVWVSRKGNPLPAEFASLTAGKTAQGGRATAYVCVGTRCTAPITDAAELVARLKEKP